MTANAEMVVIVISICVSAIIIISLFLFFVGKRIKKTDIKIGKSEIAFDSNGKELEEIDNSDLDDYKKCLENKCHPNKIGAMVLMITDNLSKIYFLKFRGTLEEQMNYVEQKLKVLREYDIKYYLDLLSSKLSELGRDALSKSDDFQAYITISYRVYFEVTEFFRLFFLENHIDEMLESDWIEYKKWKIEFLLAKMNEITDISYLSNLIIYRSELNTFQHDNLTQKIKEFYNDIFDKARKISLTNSESMAKMRKDMDDIVLSYIKGKPYIKDN